MHAAFREMLDHMSRRTFLLTGAASVTAIRSRLASRRSALPPLRIIVINGGAGAAARDNGILLGVEEARHAAALFGGAIEIETVNTLSAPKRKICAVIGGANRDECLALAGGAHAAGSLYANVQCPSDDLRRDLCSTPVLHVIPSDAMYRDAMEQAHVGSTATAGAWDPSLEKYGADTLNQRFQSRFHAPMTSEAWAGWMAVKILWESSLRARSVEPRAIVEYLRRPTTQFDGHKGKPLSLRAWDGQLRQPVYVVDSRDGETRHSIVEMPPLAPRDTSSAAQQLDRLGTRGTTQCEVRR